MTDINHYLATELMGFNPQIPGEYILGGRVYWTRIANAASWWTPTTDLNQTRLCELRMAEKGLGGTYCYKLWQALGEPELIEYLEFGERPEFIAIFQLATATAEQRCEAMVKVLASLEKENTHD